MVVKHWIGKKVVFFLILMVVCCLYITQLFTKNSKLDTRYKSDSWYFDNLNPFYEINTSDKLINQRTYIPSKYNEVTSEEKIILILSFVYNIGTFKFISGRKKFEDCPVKKCTINMLKDNYKGVAPDAVVYREIFVSAEVLEKPRQVNIFFTQECPYLNPPFQKPSIINWTATYRKDSDIPVPYIKWVYYDDKVKTIAQQQNYAANKTKKVAWVVSNCHANNNRMEYALELKKYIDVDIYGKCGTLCDKTCFDNIKNYKFYLAFENSNCNEYITEKFFVNSLQHDLIPIAMGAPFHDYLDVAPENSFIHVDDFESPKHLAEYLHLIDQNDDIYNAYFQWKGTGEYLESSFFCRLCALLHSDYKEKSYKDINAWWRPTNICKEKFTTE